MEPILRGHFNNFKQAFEIISTTASSEEDKKKDAKAFEKFVNYVLLSLDYPDIFTADAELLDFVCIGGGYDTGIDGIGIKVNDRLVRNSDEVSQITQANKKINVEFVFIQSKMQTKFDTSEFTTFGTGVKNFFSDGYLTENSKIKEFRDIKNFIYSDNKIISKLEKNPSIYLYYISTGTEPTDENFKGNLKLLKKELTEGGYFFGNVEVNVIGGRQLIKFCRELENKFEVQMNIIDIFPLIVDSKADVKKAYAFTCNASEFLKILEKEDGTLRRSLFNDNVRDYLGANGAVNSEIEKTITDSPEMFLLCNNGITIVCSDFEQVRDKLVKIENPQIVNGCQTSNSLFNLKNTSNIKKAQLLVRLISTENLSISNKIVRGTNKQNQVLDEAFEATLPFHQETLEPFFLAFENDVKIYYERRAKQYNNDPLINKTQIVNLRILTQAFVGMFLNSPHASHRHEAKLLEEYAGEKEKRKIFRDDHSPCPYYICTLTWYIFEKYFREEWIDKKYRPYKAHLYLIFKYSVGEFPPKQLIKSRALDSYCDKLLAFLKEPQFKNQIGKVLYMFDTTQNLWTESRSRFSIKDNKEFTDLLIQQSCEHFIQNQVPTTEKDAETVYKGTIFRIKQENGHWYGFIKRGYQYENVYFDNRAYKGDIKELVSNKNVKFEMGNNDRSNFATNVELID
ncbi:AIPR family protein [Nostoc sp. ChiQUE01b]|uniref:AIPR family protein n=1 Tax=Nostoc sp. ChiQUE01b TaxID=3075376 RepID=UPI002AD58ED9|nr:AIPR family protein [Nostoc sp. ChiQUE01b]MDZ8261008.1 AIPR family protein [Nostoc sp. ChiQUE01b]